ncbi:MAG: hypothetical protein HY581_02320 [Nitrospirae bacterium]|nr:hypothetical protein [Nitrospirota bacterium]
MNKMILSLTVLAALVLPARAQAESPETLSFNAQLTLQTSFGDALALVRNPSQAKAQDEIDGRPVRTLPADPVRTLPAPEETPSSLQQALKHCMTPMVLRPMGGAEEFIRYYGRCLTQDASLKIRRLEPGSERGTLAVVTEAEGPAAERMNGTVSIRGDRGMVTLRVEVRRERVFRILPVQASR